MDLANEPLYTVKYIENLPEGERAELIDGVIYDMASPTRMHQRLLFELARIIADFIDNNKGECEVNVAPFAVYLNNDEYNYVEPDLFVVCDKEKLDDKGCHGAPDWIIEVVSSSSQRMDYELKLFKYRTAGVREYWIVDPKAETVFVHNFEKNEMETYRFSDLVPVRIYQSENEDGLRIDFEEVFKRI